MRDTFRKLMDLLEPRERRSFWLLTLLVAVMGAFNMLGVASIIPFLAVLADPGVVEENRWLAAVYEGLGFTDTRNFLFALGVGVFLAFMMGLAVKALTTYATVRFGSMRNFSLSSRMMRTYLGHPYVWFLNRHSSDLNTTVLAEVAQAINTSLVPLLRVMANGAIVTGMVALMIIVQPMVALVAALVLGGSYGLIYVLVRRKLLELGRIRLEANKARFRISQEAMTGVKDIKVRALEESMLRRFRNPALRLARAQAFAALLQSLPRHLLEGIAFGGMMLLLLTLMALENGSLSEVLPVAGVYALAGSRLLPAMQQLYGDLGRIRTNRPVLEQVHADLVEAKDRRPPPPPAKPLHLRDTLALRGVRYAYPKAERGALEGLDMEIRANTTVGLVGGTGAGKTTAVDVMLGLLEPQSGTLEIDGRPVRGDQALRAWRLSIGYVPQHIHLVDASVWENVAFGIPPEEIDRAAVERAARMAELHRFVTEELPRGYDTEVGDRGIRLSGGQRQRIGIARALYHDPDMLILDEATSALDNLTEQAVMEAVANLGGAKTIVMVAHRLSTVRGCDEIFLLEKGRVSARGTYDELLERSETFRRMAKGAAA
jgi:ABC-type multidrug transport system fused ATPase/permease subunit